MHDPFDPRLLTLLEQRLSPNADCAAIDARIWELFGEEWCVMATDLAGFSRGVAEFGIIHFLQTIFESGRILVPVLESHGGTLLKVEGDSFLAIFPDVRQALVSSVEMQRATWRYNQTKAPEEQLLLGVGLGYGPVLRVAPAEIYGNEVNSACILGETHAKAYDILMTQNVRERAESEFRFEAFAFVPPGARGAYRLVYSSSSDALNGD